MSLIQTVETDLGNIGKWLEGEVEKDATVVWGVVRAVFSAAEPTIVSNVVNSIKTFVIDAEGTIAKGATLEELEQDLVQWAESEGKSILQDVETLGSTLVQALIALVIKV